MAKQKQTKTSQVPQTNPAVISIGENIVVKEEDGMTWVGFKTEHRGGVSPSGKTLRVASTLGNTKLPNGVTVGMNAYVPNPNR